MQNYKGITLSIDHTDGKINSCRLLKGRSGIPEPLLENINQIFEQTFAQPAPPVKTTVAIGDLAEQQVFAHLKKIAQTSTLEVFDRSSETGHGDLSVSYGDLNICIEVKDYKCALPQAQIDKYHKSLSVDEYHAGILICMSNGFAKGSNIRTPIDIRYHKSKPSVYLSCIDLELLYPIICIIKTMTDSADKEQLDIDELLEKIETIKEKISGLKSLVDAQKKLTDKLEKAINDISLV